MTKRDEFIRDVRRVLEAAYFRMRASTPSREQRPIHDAQVEILALAIKGMKSAPPSYELSALHYVYRTALVILGYDRDYLRASDERMARYTETGEWN